MIKFKIFAIVLITIVSSSAAQTDLPLQAEKISETFLDNMPVKTRIGGLDMANGFIAMLTDSFIDFRNEVLPIVKLNRLLELNEKILSEEESTLICVEHERGRFMIQVEDLLGRQQVVIKPLSKKLLRVKEISGSAILGNGSIALILNVEAIRDWLDLHSEKN